MGFSSSRLLLLSMVLAATPDAAVAQQSAPPPPPSGAEPIITDEEFDQALPSLDAPPMESVEDWQKAEDAKEQAEQAVKERGTPALQDGDSSEALPDPPVTDPLLDAPLPPIDSFDAEPPPAPNDAADRRRRDGRGFGARPQPF
jgi:translocation and assembly module TamA